MPDVTDGLEIVVACSSHSPGVAVERQTVVQYHAEDLHVDDDDDDEVEEDVTPFCCPFSLGSLGEVY